MNRDPRWDPRVGDVLWRPDHPGGFEVVSTAYELGVGLVQATLKHGPVDTIRFESADLFRAFVRNATAADARVFIDFTKGAPMPPLIKLGDKARDSITGYEGIVVARCEWLNGCVRSTLQPARLLKDGSVPKMETFDETQLLLVEPTTSIQAPDAEKPGGPRPDPRPPEAPR